MRGCHMNGKGLAALLLVFVLCVGVLIGMGLRPGREVDFLGEVTALSQDDAGNLLIEAVQSGTQSSLWIKLDKDMRVRGFEDEAWTVADITVGDLIEADFKRAKEGECYVAKWVMRFPVAK